MRRSGRQRSALTAHHLTGSRFREHRDHQPLHGGAFGGGRWFTTMPFQGGAGAQRSLVRSARDAAVGAYQKAVQTLSRKFRCLDREGRRQLTATQRHSRGGSLRAGERATAPNREDHHRARAQRSYYSDHRAGNPSSGGAERVRCTKRLGRTRLSRHTASADGSRMRRVQPQARRPHRFSATLTLPIAVASAL